MVKADGCGAAMVICRSGEGRAEPHGLDWFPGIGRCGPQASLGPVQRGYVGDAIEEAARSSSLGIAAAHITVGPPVQRLCGEGDEACQGPDQGHAVRCGATLGTDRAERRLKIWAGELFRGARIG